MSGKREENKGLQPVYLGPAYSEETHGFYVRQLLYALQDPRFQNLALTGPYGSGKSSIVEGLFTALQSGDPNRGVTSNRAILVSLASFDLDGQESASETEHHIQKEVLKQFIFREDPSKMPKSEFRGIVVPTWWQRLLRYLLTAFVILLTYFLFQAPALWKDWVRNGSVSYGPILRFVLLWGVITGLVGLAAFLITDKPKIKGLSVGPGRLELDTDDESYFDKYLSEIVYYFRVSKTNLVVFEDLDRFNSPSIFESLRELNQQINMALASSKKSRTQPVRFLYVLKDSVFSLDRSIIGAQVEGEQDSSGVGTPPRSKLNQTDRSSCAERAAENRTKFFDVIIPVVPFATHRNSYEFLNQELQRVAPNRSFDRELLHLIGTHVVDHRLLLNIAYEFCVFRERVIEHVSDESVLAIVAYKNTHLDDFERVLRGTSDLDQLLDSFYKHVADTQREISLRIDGLKQSAYLHLLAEPLVHTFNERLREHLQYEIGHQIEPVDFSQSELTIDGQAFRQDGEYDFKDFWSNVVENFKKLSGPIQWRASSYPIVSINPATLVTIIRSGNLSEERLELATDEANAEIDALRLFSRESRKGSIYHFREVAGRHESFGIPEQSRLDLDEMIDRHLRQPLSRDLVKKGYIDTDYYLSTSTFQEGLDTLLAQRFVVSNIERIQPSPYQKLDKRSCDAILARLERTDMPSLAGATNGDFLLHLAEHADGPGGKDLVQKILTDLKDEVNSSEIISQTVHALVDSTIAMPGNEDQEHFARDIISLISRSFNAILNDQLHELLGSAGDAGLVFVLDCVLAEASETSIEIGVEFMITLERIYASLPILCSQDSPEGVVVGAVGAIANAGGLKVDLGTLNYAASKEFADRGMVRLSSSNLSRLLPEVLSPSLVQLAPYPSLLIQAAQNPALYEAILGDFSGYSIMPGEEAEFIDEVLPVIDAALAGDSGSSEEVRGEDWEKNFAYLLSLCSAGVLFTDVRRVSGRLREILARTGLMATTTRNVLTYVLEAPGKLDSAVMELLNRNGLLPNAEMGGREPPEIDSEDLEKLGLELLQPETWPGGEDKREILVSQLADWNGDFGWDDLGALTPSKIRTTLRTGLVEDSSQNFRSLTQLDRPDLAVAFLESSALGANDFAPESFTALSRYGELLNSDQIESEIRLLIIDWLNEHSIQTDFGGEEIRSILEFAIEHDLELDKSFILKIAGADRSGLDRYEFYKLLTPVILTLPETETDARFMRELFTLMGPEFKNLLERKPGHEVFKDFEGLANLIDRAGNTVGTVSRMIPMEGGRLKVTRRAKPIS